MASLNMDRLLQACVTQGASDIHISVGRPPVLRIDGSLRSLETKVLEADDSMALMKSITPDRCQQELQEEGGTDFGFAFGTAARFRVSVFKQKGNVSIVLRQIPNKLLTFEEIGLPKIVSALCRRPRGLFLVTGPTGSGKTTTLATMINYINENFDRHIVTVEDPIEYYHAHKKSVINQREVGVDVPSFAEALRRVLRMDPDVVLVGELRDLETISNAIRAAETGHLVFSTVHTTSAAGTVNRIIDVFPVEQQEQIRTQLSGKFMVVTPAIANLIRENKTYRIESSIQTGKKLGMQLLDEHLWSLYDAGKISLESMLEKGRQPGALQQKAVNKISAAKGAKLKKKAAEAAQELEDMGPILKT